MKAFKTSIKSETFKELRVNQNTLKYFKTTSPFESPVEVHYYFNDLYIVLNGSAIVQVSEDFSEGEEKGQGEIRNCKMHTYDTFEIKTGEVLFIPFGVAHKLIVDFGDLEQIVLKIPK
jgi:mannose-6-phosphate isomerase-like protein (cupin superfamily)